MRVPTRGWPDHYHIRAYVAVDFLLHGADYTIKLREIRSGMDKDLDRMFRMFEEARVNLVAVSVPRDTNSEAYQRAKALI